MLQWLLVGLRLSFVRFRTVLIIQLGRVASQWWPPLTSGLDEISLRLVSLLGSHSLLSMEHEGLASQG